MRDIKQSGKAFTVLAIILALLAMFFMVVAAWAAPAAGGPDCDAHPDNPNCATQAPTNEPGCDPSGQNPRKCETEEPTVVPTDTATEIPTVFQTIENTATEVPTEALASPTIIPSTEQPTATQVVPTDEPTLENTPQGEPTEGPTSTPTTLPTPTAILGALPHTGLLLDQVETDPAAWQLAPNAWAVHASYPGGYDIALWDVGYAYNFEGMRFIVTGVAKTDPGDIGALDRIPDGEMLLVTCTNYHNGYWYERLLVYGYILD